MNYYISDLHLQHKNIVKHETEDAERRGGFYPFKDIVSRDAMILKHWKETITKNDDVYILGDISLSLRVDKVAEILSELPGRKHIILGNHDKNNYTELVNYPNARVVSVNRLRKISDGGLTVIMCHFPILFWEEQHKGSVHLYAHVHDSYEEDLFHMAGSVIQHNRLPEFRAINVGACKNDFTPQTLQQLMLRNDIHGDKFPKRAHHNTQAEDKISIEIKPLHE